MPDTAILIIGKEVAPVRDVQGLRLSPDASIAEAELFDVLVVPGGYGQQALMHDQEVLALIREHARKEKLLFSVCLMNHLMHLRGVGDVEGEGSTASPKRSARSVTSASLRAVAVTRSPRLRAASAQMRPNPHEAPVMNHVFLMSIPP